MIAIWITIVMTVTAVAAAMTLGWRKWAAAPAEAKPRRIEGCGCFPKVKR